MDGRVGDRERRRILNDADARIYRCGCGAWRYWHRIGRWHTESPPCPYCGAP